MQNIANAGIRLLSLFALLSLISCTDSELPSESRDALLQRIAHSPDFRAFKQASIDLIEVSPLSPEAMSELNRIITKGKAEGRTYNDAEECYCDTSLWQHHAELSANYAVQCRMVKHYFALLRQFPEYENISGEEDMKLSRMCREAYDIKIPHAITLN